MRDLTEVVEFHPPLTEDELTVALRLVQTLDRPGLAARSLSECLVLQIDALPADTPGRAVARKVVENHLDRLARREHAELQKQIGCDAEELRIACALVRKLDPKPGNSYGRSDDNYVVPTCSCVRCATDGSYRSTPAVLPARADSSDVR